MSDQFLEAVKRAEDEIQAILKRFESETNAIVEEIGIVQQESVGFPPMITRTILIETKKGRRWL